MMVQVRIERDEAEDSNMYHLVESQATVESMEERAAALEGHVWNARGLQPHANFIDYHMQLAMQRWDGLYSDIQHARLQTAMMNHVAEKYAAYKLNKRHTSRTIVKV
jgi:hypothetical protein